MDDTRKACTRCGEAKPLAEFYRYPNGKPRAQCKRCRYESYLAYSKEWDRQNAERRLARRRAIRAADPEAARAKGRADYHARAEKRREDSRRWAQNHPEQLRAYRRRYAERRRELRRMRDYGLTNEAFKALWDRQDGKCAICSKALIERKNGCHIDHDHVTGQVRGLLCGPCNHTVGHIESDRYEAALRYVQRFRRSAA